jgi:HSP20 family protein
MPSVTYMNQSAPFWDFIASLEQQGNNHPFFSQNRNENERGVEHEETHDGPSFGPFGFGADWFGGRAFPHRGPPPPRHHEANSQEHNREYDEKNPEHNDEKSQDKHEENKDKHEDNKDKHEDNKDKHEDNKNEEMRHNNEHGEGPAGNSGSDNEGCARGRGRHGRCGGGRRRQGPCGGPSGPWGRSGPHHSPHDDHHRGPPGPHGPHHGPHHGPRHGGPRGFGRRGGWGPWGRGGLFGGGDFDPSVLATQFWNQFNESQTSNVEANTNKATATDNEDHTPDADVFDTENAFVVHISLPGAKKEDVGVNWDAEKSELSIAGVIYRPGDEEFLKTLAMNERKVGPFDRKIRLGTRAIPAHIDIDGITAKLEDGILRVEVPKLDAGYVEIKKVDIE